MHNYDERATFKIYCGFVFGQANFQWSSWGTLMQVSKSLFLKHKEGSTLHETVLVVSPGSLHMNTSMENMLEHLCTQSCPKTFFLVNSVYTNNASFFVIMHLHEGLNHIQSLFGESFTLSESTNAILIIN